MFPELGEIRDPSRGFRFWGGFEAFSGTFGVIFGVFYVGFGAILRAFLQTFWGILEMFLGTFEMPQVWFLCNFRGFGGFLGWF